MSGQPLIVKAAPLQLAAGMSARQALLRGVANCLAHIRGNEWGVMAGTDPESVHQARVGVRRLRALLALWRRAPLPVGLDAELRWLAAVLGAARDWEVLAGQTLPQLLGAAAATDAAQAALLHAAAAVAAGKRRQAAAALMSLRYQRLLWRLERWQASLPLQPALAVDDFADRQLHRCGQRLARRGRRKGGKGGGRLRRYHRLRIAAKQLRYAAELFYSLYRPQRLDPLLARLGQLQDALGLLNDSEAACALLRQLRRAQPQLTAAALAEQRLRQTRKPRLRAADASWRQLAQAGVLIKARWRADPAA